VSVVVDHNFFGQQARVERERERERERCTSYLFMRLLIRFPPLVVYWPIYSPPIGIILKRVFSHLNEILNEECFCFIKYVSYSRCFNVVAS